MFCSAKNWQQYESPGTLMLMFFLFYLDTEHADHAKYLDHAEMKEKDDTWIGLRFIQMDRCRLVGMVTCG